MKIPENQLRTWSQLGAQARSQRTYQSIRNALDRHVWPPAMGSPSVYLQGSYRNHTNIAGDSDVDVVVESSGVFYDNLTPEERRLRGFQPGRYSWENFRNEVYGALVTHYSQGKVQQGNKCIHVGGCQRRSKSTPLAGVKMHHLMRFSPALAVVPVVHRRDPRCFV